MADHRPQPDAEPLPRPVAIALNLVNTSTPRPADARALRAALLASPESGGQAHARILLEEAPAPLLADLVREGFLSWSELAAAAERHPPASDGTAAWIRDMARLALARAVPARA